jgi:hypothetical protein
MYLLWGLLFLAGIYPLGLALRANRDTALRHTLVWALLAWLGWTAVAWGLVLRPGRDAALMPYLALCLTGCAGVAVLGARRPGVGAWNLVVVGLLAVLLMPVLHGLGEPRLEAASELLLAGALAVPFFNYLPTRLGPAVVLLAFGCGLETIRLLLGENTSSVPRPAGLGMLASTPWAAWALLWSRGSSGMEFDRLWLSYRDRFGFVWGQRMREQFNRAAHHAGWPVELRWGGLHTIRTEEKTDPAALIATLRAVLKRFGPEEAREKLHGM